MALPLVAEKRLRPRRRLTGLIPGKLVVQGTTAHVDCKPVDISTHGLGFVSSMLLNPGTRLMLKTHNQEIAFEIQWRQLDFGKRDLYRYGLVTLDQDLDLEEIFVQTNCLK